MRRCNLNPESCGFTLLELIIVVSILAIIALAAFSYTIGLEDSVSKDLIWSEIRNLRNGILQFKKDTGFLPRTGPFALVSDGGQVSLQDHEIHWFLHPANFDQLLQQPLDGAGNPIRPWNPDTGRGWRGPYLQNVELRVTVGNSLKMGGQGDPAHGSLISGIRGVGDPFLHEALGSCFVWKGWNTEEVKRYGRPYYFFDWYDPYWARVVSSGPDGLYDSAPLSLHPVQKADIKDDIVEFLFR